MSTKQHESLSEINLSSLLLHHVCHTSPPICRRWDERLCLVLTPQGIKKVKKRIQPGMVRDPRSEMSYVRLGLEEPILDVIGGALPHHGQGQAAAVAADLNTTAKVHATRYMPMNDVVSMSDEGLQIAVRGMVVELIDPELGCKLKSPIPSMTQGKTQLWWSPWSNRFYTCAALHSEEIGGDPPRLTAVSREEAAKVAESNWPSFQRLDDMLTTGLSLYDGKSRKAKEPQVSDWRDPQYRGFICLAFFGRSAVFSQGAGSSVIGLSTGGSKVCQQQYEDYLKRHAAVPLPTTEELCDSRARPAVGDAVAGPADPASGSARPAMPIPPARRSPLFGGRIAHPATAAAIFRSTTRRKVTPRGQARSLLSKPASRSAPGPIHPGVIRGSEGGVTNGGDSGISVVMFLKEAAGRHRRTRSTAKTESQQGAEGAMGSAPPFPASAKRTASAGTTLVLCTGDDSEISPAVASPAAKRRRRSDVALASAQIEATGGNAGAYVLCSIETPIL